MRSVSVRVAAVGKPALCLRPLRHKSARSCRLTTQLHASASQAFPSSGCTQEVDACEVGDVSSPFWGWAHRTWAFLRKAVSLVLVALAAWLACSRAQAAAPLQPAPPAQSVGFASITASQQPLTSHSWKKVALYKTQKVCAHACSCLNARIALQPRRTRGHHTACVRHRADTQKHGGVLVTRMVVTNMQHRMAMLEPDPS